MNMDTLNELMAKIIAADVEAGGQTQEQAKKSIALLKYLLERVEGQLAALAVEHQIHVYVGDYGYGRSVALEDSEDGWNDHSAGEWVASSSTC